MNAERVDGSLELSTSALFGTLMKRVVFMYTAFERPQRTPKDERAQPTCPPNWLRLVKASFQGGISQDTGFSKRWSVMRSVLYFIDRKYLVYYIMTKNCKMENNSF